jgi:hypothetical protein
MICESLPLPLLTSGVASCQIKDLPITRISVYTFITCNVGLVMNKGKGKVVLVLN